MFLDTMGGADTEAFEPTRPFSPRPQKPGADSGVRAGAGRPVLSSAMQAELRRLAASPLHISALAVLAASVRHAQPLAVHVQNSGKPFLLSIFPRERFFQCEHELSELPPDDLALLGLVRIEPVVPLLMGDMPSGKASSFRLGPLGLLLWQLALHGPTNELLPEIAEPANYRLTPSLHLSGLPMHAGMLPVLQKMRSRPCTVYELAHGSALGPTQVKRLLNAVYLQSGLIVTHSLPKVWDKT
jgi:hypothetical protein